LLAAMVRAILTTLDDNTVQILVCF